MILPSRLHFRFCPSPRGQNLTRTGSVAPCYVYSHDLTVVQGLEDAPERPEDAAHDWKFCQCGIRCIPSRWVSSSTYYRHLRLVAAQEQAVAEQRPAMSHPLALGRKTSRQKPGARTLVSQQQGSNSTQPLASTSRIQLSPSHDEEMDDTIDVVSCFILKLVLRRS